MRNRVHLRLIAACTSALLLVLTAAGAPAQSILEATTATATASSTTVDDILRRGRELESAHRWGEALTHYEDAVRRLPDAEALEERLGLARTHYDVSRRYRDSSFLRSLITASETDALSLYSEVLLKIESHYVDTPDWKHLVQRGTTAMDVALSEPGFARRHLNGVSDEKVEAFRKEMWRLVSSWLIAERRHAHDAAANIGRLAQRELGILPAVVIMEYTCGAAGSLDHYSSFLTGNQLAEVYSQIDGNFVGLGVELKAEDASLLVVKVIPGSPAERAGLHAGDRIISVNGQSTREMTTDEAADLLQGEEGTAVDVVLSSPGDTRRHVRMRRSHVEVPSIENDHIVDEKLGIAYLRLSSFQKTTLNDLDSALARLAAQGMRSLVMDLRGNPGGLLPTSVEVADRFIDGGIIVSTRGRSRYEDFDYAAHRRSTWQIPLVVLIDGDSASASEIFAGAVRDHSRGTIVGTRSYGKGSVQGIFRLRSGQAGIRLTTAHFYSPQGRRYSHVGVEPNIEVQQAARPADGLLLTDQLDTALSAGIDEARRQLARTEVTSR